MLPPSPSATTPPTYFSQNQIQAAISSFPHSSGAGPEGLRPQHLKDCISISAGDASTSLLTSITELVNHLTNRHLPTALRPFLYGAQLHGLRKNNGDLRPIAVGCTYRHLVAKVCLRPCISRLRELLQSSQLGVGTPRGCEAAVHVTRSFIAQMQGEKVLLKLDAKNAFNSIRRDTVLQAAQHTSQKSILSFGTVILQKHLSFMETSALTQPLGCNKGTLSARLFLSLPFTELHQRSNQT